MNDCLFCKIIKGEIPSYKIYEDEYTYAFLDISKDVDGHTLIISKKHYKNILDCKNEDLHHIIDTVKKISDFYVHECGFDGVNIVSNANEAAGQSVMHIHFHIVPRNINDNISFFNDIKKGKFDLNEMQKKLKIN